MSRISRSATIAIIGIAAFFTSVPMLQAEDFHGYDCTDDCSGHQAGYDWAEQNSVGSASDCGGNSQSFTEGCEAYANEHNDDAASQSDDDNDDQSNGDGGNSGDE
jgi:hypothetical protein